jgi:hypothetical protein
MLFGKLKITGVIKDRLVNIEYFPPVSSLCLLGKVAEFVSDDEIAFCGFIR